MYLFGFSIDNISLMGLTLAVGLVVDDAIVMLENIFRHMEEDGLSAFEAALKGAREIGFTIVSISISLVAVFIPVLLMGGVIGRIFNEFAVVAPLNEVARAVRDRCDGVIDRVMVGFPASVEDATVTAVLDEMRSVD